MKLGEVFGRRRNDIRRNAVHPVMQPIVRRDPAGTPCRFGRRLLELEGRRIEHRSVDLRCRRRDHISCG